MKLPVLLALLLAIPLGGQEPEGTLPPRQVFQAVLGGMKSADPVRRRAAFRSVHLFGRESLPHFEKALRAAIRHHEQRLEEALSDRDNPYRELGGIAGELQAERDRVLALIRTDWHKDPGKVRMLRDDFAGVERLHRRAVKLAGSDPSGVDRQVDAIAGALTDLHREVALFNADERLADDTPPGELKRLALKEAFDGDMHLANKARFAAMQGEVRRLAAASSHNTACDWANAPQKDFAAHLNHERAVMGLAPLRLEERLSAAATGHSEDMRSHGFFSHTSPVEGKRSPADRARLAGYRGRWSGENIFMGSPAFSAAYNGWFASDGHRFIMFAERPNVIGLGPVGSHWTLMTGRM